MATETWKFWSWRCVRCGMGYDADDPNVGSIREPRCPKDGAPCERADYTVEVG
jgi:hypothetical protein